ncbi:MAG: hypothetical protein WBV72_10570 [Nitrososphaeraceae archaeon]
MSYAGVSIFNRCNHARRFLFSVLLPITFIFLLLSIHIKDILITQDSEMHAVAQLGSLGGNISEQATGTESTPNLTSGVNSKYALNETQFLTHTDSIHGIQIDYPFNWNIVLPDAVGSRNDTASKNKDLQVISKFASPTRENVTFMIDNLVNDQNNPDSVKEFIDTVLNESRNAFAEYRLLDLGISPNSGSNLTINATEPVIYNLTYSADQSDSSDRSHIMGMDVGAIANETAYIISYQAPVDNYAKYLPDVLKMIHSFKVSDLNKATTPKSSSQATISSSPNSTSNASSLSREQTTNLTASPSSPEPATSTQQTTPPAPSTTADSAYPSTQQLYPPGYSPYPPEGYSPYVDSPYAGYSPYLDLLPYADYPPYVVIDPIIPTPPFIPVDGNPTITSYNTFNDTAGVFHIVGEVENSSPYLVTSVQVVATFYDSLGQLLYFDTVFTNPPNISAGQIAFFDLAIPPGTLPVDRVSQWTLRLVWQ